MKRSFRIPVLLCFENNVCVYLDPILTKRNTKGGQMIIYSDISYHPRIQSCKIQENREGSS